VLADVCNVEACLTRLSELARTRSVRELFNWDVHRRCRDRRQPHAIVTGSDDAAWWYTGSGVWAFSGV